MEVSDYKCHLITQLIILENQFTNIGNRPPSANNRVIMNAATGQKIGIGGVGGVTGVNGLNVASSSIQNAGVSGVGLTNLNDPSKQFTFNI